MNLFYIYSYTIKLRASKRNKIKTQNKYFSTVPDNKRDDIIQLSLLLEKLNETNEKILELNDLIVEDETCDSIIKGKIYFLWEMHMSKHMIIDQLTVPLRHYCLSCNNKELNLFNPFNHTLIMLVVFWILLATFMIYKNILII